MSQYLVFLYINVILPTAIWANISQRNVLAALLQEQYSTHTHEITLILSKDHLKEGKQLGITTSEHAIPINAFQVEALADLQASSIEPCPVISTWPNMTEMESSNVIHENEIYVRKQLIPTEVKPRSFFIWIKSHDLAKVLYVFEKSIMSCPQKVDMGLLNRSNRFLFVMDNVTEDSRMIFSSWGIKNHLNVAAVDVNHENRITVHRCNHYHETNGKPKIQKLIKNVDQVVAKVDLYPEYLDMGGTTLRILVIPFAHLVQAEFLDEDQSKPFKRLTNEKGLIIDLMELLNSKTNSRVEYYSSDPVFEYGKIGQDGIWTGAIGAIKDDIMDITMDWVLEYTIYQVLRATPYGLQEYETFASPKNMPKSKVFAFLHPFQLSMWLIIGLSVLVMPIMMFLINQMHGDRVKLQIKWYDLIFYCFTCVMGEGKSTGPGQKKAKSGQMLTLAGWLLYCTILGFAYSSTLKSVLMAPDVLPSIDTMQEVVDSDLPVKMYLYEDQFTEILAKSNNPIHQKLWKKKIVLDNFFGPLDEVVQGDAIYTNWMSLLKAAIRVQHSTSDGKPLVHLGGEAVLYKSFLAFTHNETKPWAPLATRFMSGLLDTGLLTHLEENSWLRLRRERDSNADDDMAQALLAEQQGECDSCALQLEHYYGGFLVYAIFSFTSLVTFVAEIFLFRETTGTANSILNN